jgi:hypothetical protein
MAPTDLAELLTRFRFEVHSGSAPSTLLYKSDLFRTRAECDAACSALSRRESPWEATTVGARYVLVFSIVTDITTTLVRNFSY